jgi:hypothetical protein
MKLPNETSAFWNHVSMGRYVARRLKVSGRITLSADVLRETTAVKTAGRAWEDRREVIQDAIADRDSADDALDRATQEARLQLAARSLDAVKSAPYINIFPDGIGFYTVAPLEAEVSRYNELKTRVEKELNADDAVRRALVGAIDTHLPLFTAASNAISDARAAMSVARTDLERALDAWERLMEKVYGTLVGEVGRRAAEGYFPASKSRPNQPDSDA